MNSREYWERRALLRKVQAERSALRTADEIGEAYDRAAASLQKDISYWLSRFAQNNSLSLTDAKKLLKADELKEFRWTVEEYISHGAQNADGRWAKQLENASARVHISRLEAMRTLLRAEAEALSGKELNAVESLLSDTYREQYLLRAFDLQKGLGVGWSVQRPDPRMVKILLKKPWAADGEVFSERIWKDKESLVRELDRVLTQSLITGKSPDAAAQMLVDKLGARKRQARRLVFTEAAAVSTLAEKDCYTDLGVGEYEILATLDSKTSEICRSMDGRHFPVSEMKPGVTAPPFHPNCRTDTCPYFDDWEAFGNPSRAARDEADQGYELVPAGMSYKEWEKRFVREKPVDYSAESGIIKSEVEKGNIKIGINVGAQNKHICDSTGYIPGRSYIYGTIEDAQKLIQQYRGTGELKMTRKGEWTKKEFVTADHVIGVCVNPNTGQEKETHRFSIHYGKKGTHIVPAEEKDETE